MGRSKIFQSFNNKIDAWVKYKELRGGKTKILDVKEREPKSMFRGTKIR